MGYSTKRCAAALCVAVTFLIYGCTEREINEPRSATPSKTSPQVRIIGDDKDVGSVVFLDGRAVATIEATFLSVPQVTIHLAPGRHVVEVRNGGVLRAQRVLDITSDSGVIGMPAREGP